MKHAVLRLVLTLLLGAGILLTSVGNIALSQEDAGVEADLTTHTVDIEANFAGADVQLFGSLAGQSAEGDQPDIVIVVRGPRKPMKVRRKSKVAGIWLNTEGFSFSSVPGYYAIVSNREVSDISSSYTLKTQGIGFNALQASLILSEAGFTGSSNVRDYADAAVRLMKQEKLYQEHVGGVRFSGKHLFRARFRLPANVPIGKYSADVFVFRGGDVISKFSTSLRIEKQGVEKLIFETAHRQPLIYGILSVLAAVAAGLTAAWAFNKK